ncbi:hypothetical protein Tco_0119105, partial [Tanacetum coccineum]
IEVARLLAIPTPPLLPLPPWLSPLPQIPSPPLPVSPPPPTSPTYPLVSPPPPTSPTSPTYPIHCHYHHPSYSLALDQMHHHQGHHLSYLYPYRLHHYLCCYPLLTMERTGLRFSYHLGRGYVLLLVLGTRSKRARLLLLLGRLEVLRQTMVSLPLWIGRLGEIQREVGYGITNTWDEMLEDMPGEPMTDETELGRRMTNFVTTVRQDINEIYVRLGEAQDERSLMSGRLNLQQRDRRAHAHTTLLMEREARLSHEAWGRSLCSSNLALAY